MSDTPPEHHFENHFTGEYTLVPYQQLSPDALKGIIETFIQREGTDYGIVEVDLETKYEQVLQLIKQGIAFIAFDHDSQTVTLVHKEQIA